VLDPRLLAEAGSKEKVEGNPPPHDSPACGDIAASGTSVQNDPPMIEDVCATAAGTFLADVTYTSSIFGRELTCEEAAAWYADPCNDYSQGGQMNADEILAMFATEGKDESLCCSGGGTDPTTAVPTVPSVPSGPPQGGEPTTAVPPQGGDPTPSVPTVPSVPASTSAPEAGHPTTSTPSVPAGGSDPTTTPTQTITEIACRDAGDAAGGILTKNDPPMIADICAQAAGNFLADVTYESSLFGKRMTCGETAAWYANPCNDYSRGGEMRLEEILAAFATPGKEGSVCCSGDPTTAAPTVPSVPTATPQGGNPTTSVPTVPASTSVPETDDALTTAAPTPKPTPAAPTPKPTVPTTAAPTPKPTVPTIAAPTPKPTMPTATPTPAPVVTIESSVALSMNEAAARAIEPALRSTIATRAQTSVELVTITGYSSSRRLATSTSLSATTSVDFSFQLPEGATKSSGESVVETFADSKVFSSELKSEITAQGLETALVNAGGSLAEVNAVVETPILSVGPKTMTKTSATTAPPSNSGPKDPAGQNGAAGVHETKPVAAAALGWGDVASAVVVFVVAFVGVTAAGVLLVVPDARRFLASVVGAQDTAPFAKESEAADIPSLLSPSKIAALEKDGKDESFTDAV